MTSVIKLKRANPNAQPAYVKAVTKGKGKMGGFEVPLHQPKLTSFIEDALHAETQEAEGIRQKLDPTKYEVVDLTEECLATIKALRPA